MSSEKHLKRLTKKRDIINAKLLQFKEYVKKLKDNLENVDDTNIFELEDRIVSIENVKIEFNGTQDQIEIEAENLDEQMLERSSFEDSYFATTAIAKKILVDFRKKRQADVDSNHSNRSSQQNSDSLNGIKLPTIDLPKFDGGYESWVEFRDTFSSLIEENATITNIQKFHYLRAALSGIAAQVIKSIELSSDNYKIAWDLLCDRFNNKRLLVYNHVKALFDLEVIVKESASKIRRLLDAINKHLRALSNLGQPIKHWDTLIIYMIGIKLDSVTLREWETRKAGNDLPTLDDLKKFLKSRADLLETIGVKNVEKRQGVHNKHTKSFVAASVIKCPFCSDSHNIYNCEKFAKLEIEKRLDEVKKLKLCINCLKTGHYVQFCRSSRCKTCKGKHNVLLHFEKPNKSENPESALDKSDDELIACTSSNSSFKHVLLATACVHVIGKNGKLYKAKCLLDAGAQSSFVTNEFCEKINIGKGKINMGVFGLGQALSNIKYKCELIVKSQHTTFSLNLNCLVIPEITGDLPNFRLDRNSIMVPQNIQLADDKYYEPSKVDILIGADHFWNILCVGQIKLSNNALVLQKTRFGWIISGPVDDTSNPKNVNCNFVKTVELEQSLQKFWEIEEVQTNKSWSLEETQCEKHFIETHRRADDGRFIVSLPLKNAESVLGESYPRTKKRFIGLERRLETKAELKKLYIDFLEEYEQLGHMTLVKNKNTDFAYYIPHHGVLREDSATTKLRVVFNASAITSSGKSLNDIQMVGPTIQDDLLSIVLRFRCHKYVVSADIEKMYRQVLVDPTQRHLQHILWRKNCDAPINTYELNTVTYGTASASFLAIRCLKQLAIECSSTQSDIAKVIEHDFYVDDLLTGADSIEKLKHICQQVSSELKKGCFALRKWISNDPRVLEEISIGENNNSFYFDMCNEKRTLGLKWSCKNDTLEFEINFDQQCTKVTKRSILGTIARIFDPLGLLSPCTVIAKIIMQKLWLEKLDWDESLSLNLHTQWMKFRDQLENLKCLQIPRFVMGNSHVYLELHCFADASQEAYGASIYIRSIDSLGNIAVRLLCAKAKVAPIKTQTIPKLELCAALILARLTDKVIKSTNFQRSTRVFWSDSTIVLAWLKTSPSLLKPFVSNRVSEIQNLTEINNWRHVPTKDNPADLLSRGVLPQDLCKSKLWWEGPDWLGRDCQFWPKLRTLEQNSLPEMRKAKERIFTCINTSETPVIDLERFSELNKLKRTVAYCWRFINKCRRKPNKTSHFSVDELKLAMETLIKIVQKQVFSNDMDRLSKGKQLKSNSKILSLAPFLDDANLLRVGGRLINGPFGSDKKHPILLPNNHRLTKLLFEHEHRRLLHAGPQTLLYSIRERYWPISGKNLAKLIVRNCTVCFRHNPRISYPLMGNLPERRLRPAPPFDTTGIDYAGPFMLKERKGRGSKFTKCYVSLFVCFVTKAIHIELVSDLSTEVFMMALRRFVGRRGKPSHIYSDNGTNFVGARNHLKDLGKFLIRNEVRIADLATTEGIVWHFIPSYAPHFGGLWEAGIKSTKFHIKRVAGNSKLTFEEFYSLLIQIEAILNSRPLSPLSSDPADLIPLTPAHFLVGRPLVSLPEENLRGKPENRLSRIQRVQQLQQHFWSRWSVEYLSQLQQRCKWKNNQSTLKEGTLVLIKDERAPPMKWLLGRVIAVHPGSDSVRRVATVKTTSGEVTRPVVKLCPLPLQDLQFSASDKV